MRKITHLHEASSFTVILLGLLILVPTAQAAEDHLWVFAIDSSCSEACQQEDASLYPMTSLDGQTEICSKKNLFGLEFLPGYMRDAAECMVGNLRNKTYQCLCTREKHSLVWQEKQKNSSCSQSCALIGKSIAHGPESMLPICSATIHDSELTGFAQGSYCHAGYYKSSISHCLCHD